MAMTETNIMEQRWSQRKKVTLNVDVSYHGSDLTRGVSCDVGLGGVFLKTDSQCLQHNQVVDLFFTMDNETIKHKLKARVVRELNNGYGLMFKEFDTNAFRSLQVIMKHSSCAKITTKDNNLAHLVQTDSISSKSQTAYTVF